MREKIGEYLNYTAGAFGEMWKCEFSRGVICGLAGYIVLVLLVHLVFAICRRRKKCAFLFIAAPCGNIAVSLKAVTEALRQGLAGFTQLEITRIAVYLRKKGYIFEVRGRFKMGESGARELYTALADAVKSRMRTVFGLDNIVRVDLKIEAYAGGPEAAVAATVAADASEKLPDAEN